MKINLPFEISNVQVTDPQFLSFLSQILNALVSVVNGDISLVDNCKISLLTMTFDMANRQQSVLHGLNKIPLGFILVGARAATSIYDGTTPNTDQAMYLQSSVATTVKVLVFG